jgi:hypothetical protein
VTVGAVRTPLAVLLELIATFAAVALFVAIFGQGDGPAPSFLAVAVVVTGSFTLARALQMIEFESTSMRLVGVAASIAMLFLVFRIEYAPGEWPFDPGWLSQFFREPREAIAPNGHVIAGMVALAPVWLRGVMRGVQQIEFDGVLASASVGLLVVILAALASPDTREAVSWGGLAFAYALLALMTLAVFQAPEAHLPFARFARRWTLVLSALGGIAFAMAVAAAAIDPGAFGFLAPAGEPLRVAGNLVGRFVVGPILWVGSLPFRFLFWVMDGLLPDDPREIERRIEEAPPLQEEDEPGERPLWQRFLVWGIFIVATFPVAALALALLWFAFRRFAQRRLGDDREHREDIEPASTLREDLADMFGALMARFRRAARPQSAVQIRRLYFEMLEVAASRGLERPAATTPLQFAPVLDAHFRSATPSAISRAFAASRYGELPFDPSHVRELRAMWDRIQREDWKP